MSKSAVEIKISTVVAVHTILHAVDPIAIDSALKQATGGTPDFFEDEFAVIDVANVDAAQVDWKHLVALFKQYGLNAAAVRNAPEELLGVIRAHGLSIDEGAKGGSAPVEPLPAPAATPAPIPAPPPTNPPTPAPVPATQHNPVSPAGVQATVIASPGAMIIDTPVRAGQRIYARGCDLVITAMVNNGAEVIADGSIHVYAALKGRALAGASGNADSRIFAQSMEPELVSIAGVYRTFDEGFPRELAGKAAQIRLVGDRIDIQSLGSPHRT
jgi:septum site-determining protein MinC